MSRTPFGMRAPISLYFRGFFRKSTISSSSCFSSSAPATSANVAFRVFIWFLMFAFPKEVYLPPPFACRIIKINSTTIITISSSVGMRVSSHDESVTL